ncbi:hypothetical protein F7725_011391 [Dissostichus mawsoni]|uniref:Protein kinase domain-containing protein n=1 Tax=Dissostichus mawsoni TaxID=36200 RepID=A0A7J5Z9A9_DISMA|nr:hypothetical protein F7725_011391 [Dissostichus mawsoni]
MSSLVMNTVGDGNGSFDLIQNRIESLSSKMDKLINIQEKVLNRLDGMSQDIDGIEKDMENLKVDQEEIHIPPKMMNQTQVMGREVREICQEMCTIMSVVNQRSELQANKLEGMEKLVLNMQQVISFIGETVKSSRVMKLMFKGPATRKGSKSKDKAKQANKRKSSDTINKKLDQFSTDFSQDKAPWTKALPRLSQYGNLLKDHKAKDGTDKPSLSPKGLKAQKKMKPPDATENISLRSRCCSSKRCRNSTGRMNRSQVTRQPLDIWIWRPECPLKVNNLTRLLATWLTSCVKIPKQIWVRTHKAVSEEEEPQLDVQDVEHFIVEEHTEGKLGMKRKIRASKSEGWAVFSTDGMDFQLNLKQRVERAREEMMKKRKMMKMKRGRFGQVHKCVENSSGLTLAAKVIKARSLKEKLFDRIIDENYTLMELDAVLFIRQICEGLQHMHKNVHPTLGLKARKHSVCEQNHNKVKIIDFGLARIYKPREKLRVNFGTPEFLAPEVITTTLCRSTQTCGASGHYLHAWNFDEQEFVDTTEEAKDFISKLLIVNKSWRIGASEALRHPWLSDPALHHRLHTKKTMCRSRRTSCVPQNDS